MIKLQVINCTKKYGDITALDNCSFTLTSGIYALLGPNGSGKSTLMNILSTVISFDTGDILYNDQSIFNNNDYLHCLGYMPQYSCLYEELTLFEYLNYIGNLKGLNKKYLLEIIPNVCKQVGLLQVMHYHLSTFSGGMKQRAMLAQALLNDPDILILDEPTAGLDPLKRVEIQNLISNLSKEKIIIFATHVVSDVENIAKEFLLLKQGHLIYKSSREQLCQQLIGYIVEKEVDDEEYYYLNQKHKISSIHFDQNNKRIARIINNQKDEKNTIMPNLTDVYLYVFEKELNND